MKKTVLFSVGIFLSLSLFAQTLSNELLGYQEPYSKIEGQAADSIGNIYYAGTFKGELVINNQTLLNGNGGDDVFVVKTNAQGNIMWAKNFGDSGNEQFSSIAWHRGSLYMSMMMQQTSAIDDVLYTAYPAGNYTSLVSKINPADGAIRWARKNSLPLTKVFPAGAVLYIQGALNFPAQSSTLLFEENQLEGPGTGNRMFFLYMDTSGNFRGHKLVNTSVAGSTATFISGMSLSNNRLLFLLNCPTTQSVQIGTTILPFSLRANYQVLVKTDTSFQTLQYKVLNPNGEGYGYNLWIENAGFSKSINGDSLYMILNATNSSSGNYRLDGFDVPVADRNMFLVMDTNLVTAQIKPLSVHRRGTVFFRTVITQVLADSNYYYFKGRLTGFNNALPVNGLPVAREETELIYGLKDTFDFEGPSRSFLIKAKKDLQPVKLTYLGYHVPYESPTIPAVYDLLKNNKLYFFHVTDNLWNPWVVDSALAIEKGKMMNNADRAEAVNYVSYYGDGQKIVVGQARGRTALDSASANIVSSQIKNDLFLVSYTANDQVRWYKRITHSFANMTIQKIVTRNDLTYISFNLLGPRNNASNNYLRIDSTVYFITPVPPQNAGILIVSKAGTLKLLQLPAPFQTSVVFDVFNDGTMAIISGLNSTALTVPGKSFTNSNGLYVAKIDTALAIKDAIKLSASVNTSLGLASDLVIDTATSAMKLIFFGTMNAFSSNNTISVQNGISGITTYNVVNPKPGLGVSKQYVLAFNTSFGGIQSSATIGPLNSTNRTSAQIDNRLYFLFGKTFSDSIYFNQQLIIPDSNTNVRFMLAVDTALKYINHRIHTSTNENRLQYTFLHLTAKNNKLYASGASWVPFVYDTISVGHAGIIDAITLQMDTAMKGQQVFRIASPYNENMYGCDVYADSLISFAYTTQGSPVFTRGRIAARTTTVDAKDLDENAYLQTVLLKTGVVTSVEETQRVEGFKVFPNPVRSNLIFVDLGKIVTGKYQWLLYNTEGRLIESNVFNWDQGQPKQLQFKNKLQTGNYVLVIKTKETKTIKAVKLTVIQGQ